MNIVIDDENITVLAAPETIELLVDIGPQGIRGSKIFTGTVDPNTLNPKNVVGGQTVNGGDYYIQTLVGSNKDSYMYEYVLINDSTGQWESRLKINPTIYAARPSVTFSNGKGDILLNYSDLVPSTVNADALAASAFNVQYSIIDKPGSGETEPYTPKPIASSLAIKKSSTTPYKLEIEIQAAILNTSTMTWTKLGKEVTVQLLVTLTT